ncbi:MAG: sigma-70 family RNA polymerase sigma factor [Saprospiraceae bacterium]|nr:sigma-70 family RNA polymerase sigma factor [Saprospiraceae bacterium]
MISNQIIEGCKLGDRKCQNSLVHEVAPRLLAVCRRYCSDNDKAQDALQETFINIFRYLNTYTGSGSFDGWIRRIAVTCSIAVQKKSGPIFFSNYETEDISQESNIPDAYSDMGVEEIMKLLDKLPKSLNIVFNLYVIEGYSHKEIGEMLEITDSTSRANLTKARAKLIEMIKKEDEVVKSFYPKAAIF